MTWLRNKLFVRRHMRACRHARELALIGAGKRKREHLSWLERRNAVEQPLRDEKGLPPHPAFERIAP